MTAAVRALMADSVWAGITQHAGAAYPEECCGALWGVPGEDGSVIIAGFRPLRNLASGKPGSVNSRQRSYQMDPRELLELERECDSQGFTVIGFYHSHPGAAALLSWRDTEGMVPGCIYAVISVYGHELQDISDIRIWMKPSVADRPSELKLELFKETGL